MYTQEDQKNIDSLLAKRWWITTVPAVITLAAAIAIFVYGQLNRNDVLWMVTVALTLLGGGYFLFLYGVYVRPARIYRKHVYYMLNGRMRETTGVFKFLSEDMSDHDGLECYAMLVNVGEKNDPEDDRLFYYDACKERPTLSIGDHVTVLSNDKMVSSMKAA